MSMKISGKTIIVADVVQPTNRIYPADELNAVVEKFNASKKPIYGTFIGANNPDGTIPDEKVCLKVDALKMDGGSLVCDFTILDTPLGVWLQSYLKDIKFRLFPLGNGVAKLNSQNNVVVSDYTLMGVNVKMM